ncbi:hypothetical protein SDC9_102422 [bioreactor metagenome]|uniref:Uncharacterized protein n=1 Tax=bioreactor metagenome TaxID=1076179 RepID=A0A645AQS9_9ZZZZ
MQIQLAGKDCGERLDIVQHPKGAGERRDQLVERFSALAELVIRFNGNAAVLGITVADSAVFRNGDDRIFDFAHFARQDGEFAPYRKPRDQDVHKPDQNACDDAGCEEKPAERNRFGNAQKNHKERKNDADEKSKTDHAYRQIQKSVS